LALATDRPVFDLIGHSGGSNGVAYSPDGRYLAITSLDRDQSGVENLAFSPTV